MKDATGTFGECGNCGLQLETTCVHQTGVDGVFCSNVCLNEIKAEKIRPEGRWADLSEEEQFVVETLSATEAGESPAVATAGAKDLLKRLLSVLSPKDRLIIQMLHLEERSVAEISKLTGWNVPVIKVRAFRARKKLKAHLAQLEQEEQV